MSNKYKYHTSLSFIDVESGATHLINTQLYSIGVYVIINNDPGLQFNQPPSAVVKNEKHIIKLLNEGKIKDLVFGREITVIIDKDGSYTEL